MELCGDYHLLEGVRILLFIITILKIVIPILLIGFGSYDFFQAVSDPNKNSVSEKAKSFGIRIASAVIIFLLPTIITTVVSLLGDYSYQLTVVNEIIESANKDYINIVKQCNKNALKDLQKEKTYISSYDSEKYKNFASKKNSKASGNFLETAQRLFKKLDDENFTYSMVYTPAPPTGKTIDCSSFVTWVLYESGYEDFKGQHYNTNYFANTNWQEKYGWEEISVAQGENVVSKLQAGDILVRDAGAGANGHITIVSSVEDGQVYTYDAGATSHWEGQNGQAYNRTDFASGQSGNGQHAGKIIRITSSGNNSSSSNDSSNSNGKKIIVLDPGHGKSSSLMSDTEKSNSGYTTNAGKWGEWRHFKTGTWGQECQGSGGPTDHSCWYGIGSGDRDKEPEITLNYANATKKYLEQMGYEVRMTRTSNNENPSFNKRAAYAFKNQDTSQAPDAQAIVCLHSNAGGGSGSAYIALSGNYTQKYIPSDYTSKSNALGKAINDEIVSQTALNNYGSGVINGEGYLILFHKSPVIVAYMEIGFFDNNSDLSIITQDYDKIGKAIADGINKGLQ